MQDTAVAELNETAAAELEALQIRVSTAPGIFRSQIDGVSKSWCASIRHSAAGIEPMVMSDSAKELREALMRNAVVEDRELTAVKVREIVQAYPGWQTG